MEVTQCPVCQGNGKVLDPFIPAIGNTLNDRIKVCHGCSGRGYIQIYGAKDMELMMLIPELKQLIIDNMKKELEKQKGDSTASK